MKIRHELPIVLFLGLILGFFTILLPDAARAANVSQTEVMGKYSVTLKVLPAESFAGPKAEMVRDAGAEPVRLNSPAHPNHHMVVFIARDGKPVENASVTISYRVASQQHRKWIALPVARMYVAGKGVATTHYGNNLDLAPGDYEARVTINGKGPVGFHFSL